MAHDHYVRLIQTAIGDQLARGVLKGDIREGQRVER